MKWRPRRALTLAFALVGAHLLMRVAGLGVHTSALAGMPPSEASLVIAPLYIAIYLLAITLAPILVGASVLEAIIRQMAYKARE